jgi:hypothetical protein
MCDGSGARLTALQMFSSWRFVHRMWASGHRDALRTVPRYPPSREGFILCEDPYALAPKGDVDQPGSECVVSIRFLRKD